MLASASRRQDSTVKVWNTTNGQERLKLRGQRYGLWSVAFSPNTAL
jgi:WD40 repeat protein